MNAVRKQREWTPEQRLQQSRKLRERQIWLKSTGPKTGMGKSISSRNARKADYAERMAEHIEMKHIKRYLRTQKSYTDLLKFFIKQCDMIRTPHKYIAIKYELKNLENELIDIEIDLRSGYRISNDIIPFSAPLPWRHHKN